MPAVQLASLDADQVRIDELVLPDGATIADALTAALAAGLLPAQAGEALQAGVLSVAVNGRARSPEHRLSAFDRIELLGPLTVDPKIARQRRVAHRRAALARDKWSGPGR